MCSLQIKHKGKASLKEIVETLQQWEGFLHQILPKMNVYSPLTSLIMGTERAREIRRDRKTPGGVLIWE